MAFSLAQAHGARLLRGRELVGARLAWAGFGYALRPGRPGFAYDLRFERRRRGLPMSSVLLIYPYFRRSLDRSRFRFPPLGSPTSRPPEAAGHDVRCWTARS